MKNCQGVENPFGPIIMETENLMARWGEKLIQANPLPHGRFGPKLLDTAEMHR